jgi:hypothetical protein
MAGVTEGGDQGVACIRQGIMRSMSEPNRGSPRVPHCDDELRLRGHLGGAEPRRGRSQVESDLCHRREDSGCTWAAGAVPAGVRTVSASVRSS